MKKVKMAENNSKSTNNKIDASGIRKVARKLPDKNAGSSSPKCKTCGFTFSRRAGLKRHNCYKTLKIRNVMFSLYPCHQCRVAYPSKNQLAAHIKEHGNVKSEPAEESLMQDLDHDSFKCEKCGIKFEDNTSLVNHVVTHVVNGHDTYECESCGKTLACLDSLRVHRLVHQFDEPFRPYKCQECGSAFRRKFSLTRHVSSVHSGKKAS